MARRHANNGRIYRAVITRTYEVDSREVTTPYGPYDKRHTAQAQITTAVYHAKQSHGCYRDPAYAYSASGHIESAEVIWLREAPQSEGA